MDIHVRTMAIEISMMEVWVGLRCVHVSLVVVILSLRKGVGICLGGPIAVCIGGVCVGGAASRGRKGRGAAVSV